MFFRAAAVLLAITMPLLPTGCRAHPRFLQARNGPLPSCEFHAAAPDSGLTSECKVTVEETAESVRLFLSKRSKGGRYSATVEIDKSNLSLIRSRDTLVAGLKFKTARLTRADDGSIDVRTFQSGQQKSETAKLYPASDFVYHAESLPYVLLLAEPGRLPKRIITVSPIIERLTPCRLARKSLHNAVVTLDSDYVTARIWLANENHREYVHKIEILKSLLGPDLMILSQKHPFVTATAAQ